MKRSIKLALAIAMGILMLIIIAGIRYKEHEVSDLPFRCYAFSHYDLSRHEDKKFEFDVSQDLRFIDQHSGYLLLNGQVTFGDQVTMLNRRIVLTEGKKIEIDTYRNKIKTIITSTNDTTPDAIFNQLLAEISLDPTHVQLQINQIDRKTYLITGPLSYLFTCQRY